uniref:Uncharacterized protein n=1 Tax=Biomphalaria glabrata TaxID=6526 RepID=A0A2C9KQD3_BIOGL
SEWSTYLEKEAKKVYSRFNFNSYDVKVEFLRFNYVQLLKTVLTKEKVKSEQLFPPVPGISAACYVHLMDWFDGVARWKNRTEKPDQEDMKWTLKSKSIIGFETWKSKITTDGLHKTPLSPPNTNGYLS